MDELRPRRTPATLDAGYDTRRIGLSPPEDSLRLPVSLEPGVDAINKHVRVNELCHARRDHLDASRVGLSWLDVENPCFVVAVFFAPP